jgi:hypothetical protein
VQFRWLQNWSAKSLLEMGIAANFDDERSEGHVSEPSSQIVAWDNRTSRVASPTGIERIRGAPLFGLSFLFEGVEVSFYALIVCTWDNTYC